MLTTVGELMSDLSVLIMENLEKKSGGDTAQKMANQYFGEYYSEEVRAVLVDGGFELAYIAVTEETLRWLSREKLVQESAIGVWAISEQGKSWTEEIDNKLDELMLYDTSEFDFKYVALMSAIQATYRKKVSGNWVPNTPKAEKIMQIIGGVFWLGLVTFCLWKIIEYLL